MNLEKLSNELTLLKPVDFVENAENFSKLKLLYENFKLANFSFEKKN